MDTKPRLSITLASAKERAKERAEVLDWCLAWNRVAQSNALNAREVVDFWTEPSIRAVAEDEAARASAEEDEALDLVEAAEMASVSANRSASAIERAINTQIADDIARANSLTAESDTAWTNYLTVKSRRAT